MTALDDEQLGRLLGDRLHEETYTMTAPSNLTETLHHRNRRRTRALGLAVAAPVVAAVAVGASLAFAPGGVGGGGAPKEAPEMLTVGYVAEQTATALGQLPGYVQHETAKHQGRDGKQASLIELWADRTTSRERQDNKIYYGDVRSYTLALDGSTAVELNHDKKKWWTYQIGSLKPADTNQVQYLPPSLNPKDLKRAVDSGKVTLVGEERLDGRQTVHLQWLGGPDSAMDAAAKTAEESMQIWVDKKSYLPVRVVNKLFTGTTTSDYEWLPRSKENLAKVTVSPPADYRKLPCTPTPAKDCGLND
ncbi:hypothetical protein [Micromonospora sp. NPDC005979]|uniref:hypothetical protein n=1 Tax=Micromonospora sp. NPDC005979 TaxID=3156726 RepID=UPI0033A69BA0